MATGGQRIGRVASVIVGLVSGVAVAAVAVPVLGFLAAQIEYLLGPIIGWGGRYGADPFWGQIVGWIAGLGVGFFTGGFVYDFLDSRIGSSQQQ